KVPRGRGKPSAWHRGVAREHQVLICPDCYPTAVSDLSRCSRCDSVRLVKRLDQNEGPDRRPTREPGAAPLVKRLNKIDCLDCRLTRDADAEPSVPAPRGEDSGLAAEVASALAR